MCIKLVCGVLSAAQLLYQVKDLLNQQNVPAQCFVGEDMYFSGYTGSKLVVLFVNGSNESHPAFAHEHALVERMAADKTPCIIVYGNTTPEYLRDDSSLNVIASFVPPPPVIRPQRPEDIRGTNCHFYRSPQEIANVAIKTYQRHEERQTAD